MLLGAGTAVRLSRDQFGNADQVVGDQIEHEVGGDAADAAMFGLAHGAVLLAPTEYAFDHRAARLRHAIAIMLRGASVDGAFPSLAGLGRTIVLRHMRCDVAGAKIGHMIGRVIGLVLAGGDPAAGGFAPGLEHGLRGAALGGAIGVSNHAGHRQAMPVLHGGMAHIGEFSLSPRGLAVKPAVRVRRTGMGVVLALLPVEVGAAVFVATAVLGAKALL